MGQSPRATIGLLLVLLLAGCPGEDERGIRFVGPDGQPVDPSNPADDDDDAVDVWQGFDGVAWPTVGDCSRPSVPDPVTVAVIYDTEGEYGYMGPHQAQMLMNLLGHFAEVEAWAVPTTGYDDDIAAADVTFYVGTTWDQELPADFIDDFHDSVGTIVWIGWNLWQLYEDDEDLEEDFLDRYGFTHRTVSGGSNDDFFRRVHYNGETFDKWSWWNPQTQEREWDRYINRYDLDDGPGNDLEVVAEIERADGSESEPYVLRSDNLWVIADVGFTYLHRDDRYLVIADLMHDFVGIDHETTRRALFRLEDVHPYETPANIGAVADELARGGDRPWNMALIPEFRDPLGVYNGGAAWSVTMASPEAAEWREEVEWAMAHGARLIQHGYTHQLGDEPNPWSGMTAEDYEFWDEVNDRPVSGDSYEFVQERIARAQWLMEQVGWQTWAFEVPHYRASILDYLVFPRFYCTTWHEQVLYDYRVEEGASSLDFSDVWNQGTAGVDWDDAGVQAGDEWASQFFPYLIGRDVYGQRAIPENLGNLSPEEHSELSIDVRMVDDMLATAERNLAGRCAYASFFFHAHLIEMNDLGDGRSGTEALRALIEGVEELGYEFVQPAELEVKQAL